MRLDYCSKTMRFYPKIPLTYNSTATQTSQNGANSSTGLSLRQLENSTNSTLREFRFTNLTRRNWDIWYQWRPYNSHQFNSIIHCFHRHHISVRSSTSASTMLPIKFTSTTICRRNATMSAKDTFATHARTNSQSNVDFDLRRSS